MSLGVHEIPGVVTHRVSLYAQDYYDALLAADEEHDDTEEDPAYQLMLVLIHDVPCRASLPHPPLPLSVPSLLCVCVRIPATCVCTRNPSATLTESPQQSGGRNGGLSANLQIPQPSPRHPRSIPPSSCSSTLVSTCSGPPPIVWRRGYRRSKCR